MKPIPVSNFQMKSAGLNPLHTIGPSMSMPSMGVQDSSKPSFKNVLTDVVQQVNTIAVQPDQMMQETVTNGTYDIHDVMVANAKAEITVNIAAQFATKVVQAYDRILQIQI